MFKTDSDFQKMGVTINNHTNELIRSFIERFERLDLEKKDISDAQKEVMAEAQSTGFDTKALRKIIAERKRDQEDLAEEQALVELYKTALGM